MGRRHFKPELLESYKEQVLDLGDAFSSAEPRQVSKARRALKQLLGAIPIYPCEEGHLLAKVGLNGPGLPVQQPVVAGAGFEPATFGL